MAVAGVDIVGGGGMIPPPVSSTWFPFGFPLVGACSPGFDPRWAQYPWRSFMPISPVVKLLAKLPFGPTGKS